MCIQVMMNKLEFSKEDELKYKQEEKISSKGSGRENSPKGNGYGERWKVRKLGVWQRECIIWEGIGSRVLRICVM